MNNKYIKLISLFACSSLIFSCGPVPGDSLDSLNKSPSPDMTTSPTIKTPIPESTMATPIPEVTMTATPVPESTMVTPIPEVTMVATPVPVSVNEGFGVVAPSTRMLVWEAVSSAESYNVYIREKGDTKWSVPVNIKTNIYQPELASSGGFWLIPNSLKIAIVPPPPPPPPPIDDDSSARKYALPPPPMPTPSPCLSCLSPDTDYDIQIKAVKDDMEFFSSSIIRIRTY